jgi:hypothetical protein
MSYAGDLDHGQQLYLENAGEQTVLSLSSRAAGQQQTQSSSFQTGSWSAPPTLFRVSGGFILRIESGQRQTFVGIQANQWQLLSNAPSLQAAETVPLRQVNQGEQSALPPMQPMQPMKMGDMEMQMNPMQMRMGNMELRMDEARSPQSESAPAQKQFCSQCGQKIQVGDRFCAYCGHQL